MVIQWLGPNAGGPDLIPGQGTRSHMPQLRVHLLHLKILCATTKTPCSQINSFLNQLPKKKLFSKLKETIPIENSAPKSQYNKWKRQAPKHIVIQFQKWFSKHQEWKKQATDKGTEIRMSDFSSASLGRLNLRKLVANLESYTQPIWHEVRILSDFQGHRKNFLT